MLKLLPTELHFYTLKDALLGLRATMATRTALETISLPGLGDGIPIRSARAAVIVALKALGMPPGSKVGVPLYCCPVVFKAIKAAGCQPEFIDVDPETYCISTAHLADKAPRLDALIPVHMFGNLCEMPALAKLMIGKPVIEDCAQSFGSKLGERASGSFGNISFFSFRSGKYLSVGEGAALYTADKDLHKRMSEDIAALPVPARDEELKHILTTYLRAKLRSRTFWGPLGSPIWGRYNKRTEFADKSPIVVGRVYSSDLATVNRRLPGLDSMISFQRAHADYFEHNLHLGTARLCREKPGAFYNRFMYPISFDSAAIRDALAAFLRARGVDISTPYEEAIAGAAKHYGYRGDCPTAERLLKTTLIIPSWWRLKQADVEHIVRSLNEGWEQTLSRQRRV